VGNGGSLALGFTRSDTFAPVDQLGIALDARGNIAVDDHYATKPWRVRRGRRASLIVWAITEARDSRATRAPRSRSLGAPRARQDLPF
jgi:glutamate synthase (NADPH/NADH) small chain